MIQGVFLGRENSSTAKSRILGIVESLMLISDWHPRSVQLPTDSLDWDGEPISQQCDRRNVKQRNRDALSIRWQGDVFESVNRSDELSWGLLGTAVTLALRAGTFLDEPPFGLDARCVARFHRTRKLLYVYATEIASRLGCSSLLSENVSSSMSPSQENESRERSSNSCMDLWLDLTKLKHLASVSFSQKGPATKQVSSGNYNLLCLEWYPSLKL